MGLAKSLWTTPQEHLRAHTPQTPVLYFAPTALQDAAQRILRGFPGLVTYAVKANPDDMVIENLAAAGVRGFDVASPAEIALVRRLVPGAAMHYNNPVRSRAEIAAGVAAGVCSWSVDSHSELAKLAAQVPGGAEIAVRFKLPVAGAAYDFGTKFGAAPEAAVTLLAEVARLGFTPSLTFHPGTQCTEPAAWAAYVKAAADIARRAGVRLARLNVGGGFPSHRRAGAPPALDTLFEAIAQSARAAFGALMPALVCEPGRAMVADSVTLATRVRAIRDDAAVFLNDGIYGALAESALVGMPERISVLAPSGAPRRGPARPRIVFGPTCDSVDRLPGEVALPADTAEEDFVLFHGTGAYSTVTATRFNGFGALDFATVRRLA